MTDFTQLSRLIIENQSEDGSISISDQAAMRDEIIEFIEQNYVPKRPLDQKAADAKLRELWENTPVAPRLKLGPIPHDQIKVGYVGKIE
jgi:hypothetical protein